MNIIMFPADIVLKLVVVSTIYGAIVTTFLYEISFAIKNKNYTRIISCIVLFTVLYLIGVYWGSKVIYSYIQATK